LSLGRMREMTQKEAAVANEGRPPSPQAAADRPLEARDARAGGSAQRGGAVVGTRRAD